MQLSNRIVADPEFVHGRPRVAGTRIRVTDVLGYLASGMTPDEVVEDFPELSIEDVLACLRYAAAEQDHYVLAAI